MLGRSTLPLAIPFRLFSLTQGIAGGRVMGLVGTGVEESWKIGVNWSGPEA